MKLRNPPIVEAWIEFHLEASAQETTWKGQAIDEFFALLIPEFSSRENIFFQRLTIEKQTPAGLPVEGKIEGKLNRVRAFDSERRRCVQVGENVLVFNAIRHDSDYMGFTRMCGEAMRRLDQYSRIFRPQFVRAAALHYMDVVKLPFNQAEPLKLEEHFTLGVQLPQQPQLPLNRLRLEVSIPIGADSSQGDQLALAFGTEPPEAGTNEYRFRLDWHATCAKVDTLDEEVLKRRLQAVHGFTVDFFRRCFTKKTWSLFGPEKEEA